MPKSVCWFLRNGKIAHLKYLKYLHIKLIVALDSIPFPPNLITDNLLGESEGVERKALEMSWNWQRTGEFSFWIIWESKKISMRHTTPSGATMELL